MVVASFFPPLQKKIKCNHLKKARLSPYHQYGFKENKMHENEDNLTNEAHEKAINTVDQEQHSDQPRDADEENSEEAEGILQKRLESAESQIETHRDAWLRAKAEAENIRKRSVTDINNARKFGNENFIQDLLPVKDSLEAALKSENSSIDALKNGVELTLKQLESVFSNNQIQEIYPLGEALDPNLHQAMSTVSSDKPNNTIVEVLQKGYLLHERLVRPALVTVAKKSPEQEAEE